MEPRNNNFVQLSKGYLKDWRGLVRSNPLSVEILMYLIERMGKTSNAVICSYSTLMEVTGYSRTSVAKSLSKLKKDKWVDAVRVGNATAYAVNEKVAWQSGVGSRKYAMFSATVVASSSEQSKDYSFEDKEKLKYIPMIQIEERPVLGSDDEVVDPDQGEMDLD